MKEKIEILNLEFFQALRDEIAVAEKVHGVLSRDVGWHYWLDFAWILNSIRDLPRGSLILDAGAGWGLTQFILVELGYNVISADFSDRPVSGHIKRCYGGLTHRLNSGIRQFDNRYIEHMKKKSVRSNPGFDVVKNFIKETVSLISWRPESRDRAVRIIEGKRFRPAGDASFPEGRPLAGFLDGSPAQRRGRLFIYKCDIKDMGLLPDGFVDAVVSVSALEHNDHEDLVKCVSELERVTKPGGRMAITVSASQGGDWFHEPSKGWCFCEASLRGLFGLPDGADSNFSRKDEFFESLRRQGNELHKRLSPAYFRSGDNGMPWGVWDPKYQPVGVLKEVRGNKADAGSKDGPG